MRCRVLVIGIGTLCVLLKCVGVLAAGNATFDQLLQPGGDSLTYEPKADRFPLLDGRSSGSDVASKLDKGRLLYEQDWSQTMRQGRAILGPDFDATSCGACHTETARHGFGNTLPWIARPINGLHRNRYGNQLSTRYRGEGAPEAVLHVRYSSHSVRYSNGDTKLLRRPIASAQVEENRSIPVALRTAPLLFGWGLIEAADRKMLACFHDPEDSNSDGISGRMATVNEEMAFLGWKNTAASLQSQIATALNNDMGISSDTQETREIHDWEIDALARYVSQLGVPQRRPDGDFWSGQTVFGRAGCAACHVPALMTVSHADPRLSEQLIWPYSDLMLHDMGPGLSDAGDDPMAAEWRTAPLWGLGLVEQRLPGRGFLHDGRARDIEEAILWHGGEAKASRDYFVSLSRRDRAELLRFVRSL